MIEVSKTVSMLGTSLVAAVLFACGGPTTGFEGEVSRQALHRGERCGNSFCPAGKVCCNDSCGICTEPDGFCTMQYCSRDTGSNKPDKACAALALCIEGYRWDAQKCRCVPDRANGNGRECRTDADCYLVSSYCGGCDCLAYGVDEPVPLCPDSQQVQCFADPCGFGQVAACDRGQCVVSSGATQ